MAVHFVRAAPQQHQSAARPETVHSTHHHHRPYWLSLIFLKFNYQSPTSCTMFVQSPGKSCITTYIITESGRDNRFLPAPPTCCPEFVQSQSQAKYILLSSCHHQSHPAGSQTGEVRTEISGVSLRHTATYICHTSDINVNTTSLSTDLIPANSSLSPPSKSTKLDFFLHFPLIC